MNYRYEAKKSLKVIPDSEILWFGNCESIMTLGNILEGRRFVASILELYDDQKMDRQSAFEYTAQGGSNHMLRETSSSYYEKPLSSEKAPLCYA